MSEVLDKLVNKFGDKKVKVSDDYFEKYGVDWYKGIKPDPLAIIFPEKEQYQIKLVNLSSILTTKNIIDRFDFLSNNENDIFTYNLDKKLFMLKFLVS